jgi:hypothetical protein
MCLQEYVMEKRVRTDQRWDAGVGASGGKPRSSARVGRSLDVDEHNDVELAERGQHDTNNEEDYRDGKSAEVRGRVFRTIGCRRKTPVRGV